MRRRFFVDRFDGRRATLSGDSAHHAGRVLRVAPGQLYELSDGHSIWLARVETAKRDAVEFSLLEPVEAPAATLVTRLLLSIVKFDRFEWALEKASELGVAEIIPLAAGRSEKTLVTAAKKRADRWEKILLESAQQSRRLSPAILDEVGTPFESLSEAARRRDASIPRILLSERPTAPPLRDVLTAFPRETTRTAVLAVGPEGGWTDEEFALATRSGFAEVSLGPTILRTETAVTAALASINYALGY